MMNQDEKIASSDVRLFCSRKLFELLRDQRALDADARTAIASELQQRRDYQRELASLKLDFLKMDTETRPH